MRKKLFGFLMTIVFCCSIVACGSETGQESIDVDTLSMIEVENEDVGHENETIESELVESEAIESELADILGKIIRDYDDVTKNLTKQLEETFKAVGSTYEDYQKNKGCIDEWVKLVLSESDALFERTRENSITYFKLVASDPDHKYSEFCDEALDEYYDVVYDEAMDEYYDNLYDEAMDDLYDEYYDGIIDDAYEDVVYSEWSKTSSECYQMWSEASSAIYKKWSDESSYIYGLWSTMNSAFCWNDNYEVDAIVAEYEKEKAEEDKKKAEEEKKEYIEFDVLYEVKSDGTAEVVGFNGEGNQITIDSSYEGHDVVRIADSAFENCTMLEQIIMWAELEEIGASAFKGCTGLKEIYIGSDMKIIGSHAFEGCTGVTSLLIWNAETIGDYAFAGCTGIEWVEIPMDVISIGNHAFDGCTALTSVIVWDDNTAIGKDAFANCPNLYDVPDSRGTVVESVTGNTNDNEESETITPEQNKPLNEIRPEFKEAMDSYEAFYDEYCDFMKKYLENPMDMTLLAEYVDMVEQLGEMDEMFETWENNDLSDAELKYYLEVSGRIMQKMIEIM